MTAALSPKQRRLANLERDVRWLREHFEAVLRTQANTALMMGHNRRLIGEVELRDQQIAVLRQARKA